MSIISRVLLLTRESVFPQAVKFYTQALGLPVRYATDSWAEFGSAPVPIVLKTSDDLAQTTTGYSPFLSFDVPDLNASVQAALQLGGALDGPIKYPPHGKAAVLRAPCGHMLSLYEGATATDEPPPVPGA